MKSCNKIREGYIVCGCKKYAHIFSAEVLRRLPDGYAGELCPKCNLWMCAIDKIEDGNSKKLLMSD